MKSEIITVKTGPKFEPIVVQITLETRSEAERFKDCIKDYLDFGGYEDEIAQQIVNELKKR